MDSNSEEGDSDMSWQHDSPNIIFQDPRPFAEFAREEKRNFDVFAEGQQLQQSRSFSDYTLAQTLDHKTTINSSLTTDPRWQPAGTEGVDNTTAWQYLYRPCTFISSLAFRAMTHPINIKAWKTVYGTTRYILSRNKRIDTTFIAIEQIADGTKRRCIELVTSRRHSTVSEQELRRRRAYLEQRANGHNNQHNYPTNQHNGRTPMEDVTPHPGEYCMSGALSDADLDGPSTPRRLQGMPGTWLESPDAYSARYWNSPPREIYADSISPERDVDVTVTDPATTTQTATSNNAWPYCSNEIYINLKPMDIDDEDSTMSSDDTSEQGSPATSDSPSGNPDTASSSESEDDAMPDISGSELDSSTSDQEYMLNHGSGCPGEPLFHAGHHNTSPDAVQRAAADEMQAIYDEDASLLENILQSSPSVPSETFSSSSFTDPANLSNSIQTPPPAINVASETSPLNLSNYSTSTIPTQDSAALNSKTSLQDSPAWSYQVTPDPEICGPSPLSARHLMPSTVRLSPQPLATPKTESARKRVTFFQSPKTGKPVNRYKKYVIGECMDISYVSASTNEDCSILSDTSASAQLHTSPTYPEQREKQLMVERTDQVLLRSLGSYTASLEALPHIPTAPPPRVLSQITNVRTRRRRGTTGFAITAVGSPTRLRSSDIDSTACLNTPADESLVFTKDSFPGKENSGPLKQGDVLADPNISVSTPINDSRSHLASTHMVSPTLAEGNLAHAKESSSFKERFPRNQTTPNATTTKSTSRGSLGNGKDLSPNKGNSLSYQIEPSAAPTTPYSSSSQDSSMRDTDYSSRALSPSSQLECATTTPSPGSTPAEETPDNGKDTDSTASPSTRVEALDVASTPEPSLVEGTLLNGKDSPSGSAENGSSPSNLVETLAVASTPKPSLAGGTLVNGKDSPSAERGSSPSNQVDAPVTPSPSQVARQLEDLVVSGRRSSIRHAAKIRKAAERRAAKEAAIAAEKARKEKEKAEEKARKEKELEEERKRTGLRRTPVENIIKPLPVEWEAKVDRVMHEPMTKVITTSVAAMTELTRRDFGKVLPQRGVPGEDPRGWLNDTIISAYLETAVDHALTASGYKRGDIPKQVAFSTYFYPKLANSGAQSVTRWVGRARVGGKKLKDVERVYIPVNMHGAHWTLLVISPKFKLIEYFDSFHGNSRSIIENAKALLQFELKEDFKEEEWTAVGVGGPTQTNGSDCGVFVSTTAKMISLGVDPMAYSAVDIPLQRRRIVAELMNRGFGGDLNVDVVFPEDC